MNVRDEPVTPCTIEMLPASRLESCQEQGGAKVAHQPFVEELVGIVGLRQSGEDGAVDVDVAFTAAGGDDHVHAAEQLGIALHAGVLEREAGGIGADALPRLHLPLVALFRDLFVEVDRDDRMHDAGCERLGVGRGFALVEFLPMCFGAFAERGDDADAGDPDFATRLSHR